MQRFLIHIILLATALRLSADIPPIHEVREDPYQKFGLFEHWPDEEHGTVTDILQDSTGYIWLATTNGLYRFDGFQTKKYIKDWTPGSVLSDYINDLHIIPDGRMLVGTKAGLCYYDPEKDIFKPLYAPSIQTESSDTFNIRAINHQGDSLIWFDAQAGVLSAIRLKNRNRIKHFYHSPSYQPYYLYHALETDSSGQLWFGGRGNGPFILGKDKKAHYFTKISIKKVDAKDQKNDCSDLFLDPLGDFWMCSLSGIYFLHNDSLLPFLGVSSWDITCSRNGEYWFGAGDKLARYNRTSGKLTIYPHNEENPSSLPGNYIHRIFEDRSGNIWVSTNRGLAVFQPTPPGIQNYFHIPAMEETPASSKITELASDGNNGLWLSTEHHGIDHLNIQNGKIKHYNKNNVPGMKSSNVRCFISDNRGGLYLGLWSGTGFGRLDPEKRTFENFAFNPNSRNNDWYNDLVLDKEGKLYLGFWGAKGLTLFDTAQKKYQRSLAKKFNPYYNARLITCLHFDESGNLWTGTTQAGLHCFLPDQDTAISYFAPTNPSLGLPDERIYDIADGPNQSIIIAGKHLYIKKPDNDKPEQIKLSALSEDERVFKVLTENDHRIWLLGSFGTALLDFKGRQLTSINRLSGLKYTANNAAAALLPDGKIALGGSNGITIMDPKKAFEASMHYQHLYFSQLNVFDQPKFYELNAQESYNLKHSENFFSIHMGGDFADQPDLALSYILEGFQKEWKQLPRHIATAQFTNVPLGEYIFKIRLHSRDNKSVLSSKKLILNISPPWWQEWWFLSGSFLIFAGITSLFVYSRVHTLKLRLNNAELNQKLLRLQMNPHFIFNSLFAIQNYIYSNQTHLAGKYLSDFAKLIRMILNYSRLEAISIEQEMETTRLYLDLQKLRFGERMEYEIHVDQKLYDADAFVPPMLAQPFIENSIEHGIKTLKHKGIIRIIYALDNENIVFTIEDNGIGLEATSGKKGKKGHKSLATGIVRDRLQIISERSGRDTKFNISEIRNDDGKSAGTRVVISVPLNLSKE